MNENIASEQYQGAPSVPEETTKSPQKLRAGKTSERPVFDAVVKTTKYLVLSLFLIYVVFPSVMKIYPRIQEKLIFLNFVCWPPFMDVTKPDELGLTGVRNFYLNVDEEITIGAWHLLPKSLIRNETIDFESKLSSGHPIFLYLHGSTGTRGGWHRVQLMKLLTSLDFHVVTIDYRGYADSTGHPSEDGVVDDSHFMYRWIKERSGASQVVLWGHSLGAAITTKLAKRLCEEGVDPHGVILESPFNNIRDAALSHPFAAPFQHIPFYKKLILDSVAQNNVFFTSDENIAAVKSPVIIMHAEDDLVIPYDLGLKLYKSAQQKRPEDSGPLQFVPLKASFGYGHKHIFQAPELPEIIKNFLGTCKRK